MKRLPGMTVLTLILCAFFLLSLSGCGEEKSGNTLEEPEITSEYLENDYAQQLLTDGAETILGYVSIAKEGDAYKVHITEQEVVPSADYEEGYYIADTNLSKDAVCDSDARIVCMQDGEQTVTTTDDFIEEHADDSDQLYTVYLMGDSAELILATDPKSVEVEE